MLQLGLETTPDEDTRRDRVRTPTGLVAVADVTAGRPNGTAVASARPAEPVQGDAPDDELFTGLVASNPRKVSRKLTMRASLVVHTVAITLIFLVPILWPGPPPEERDRVVALIYNPPPPPPPPLPKGQALVEKQQTPKKVTPDPTPQKEPDLTVKVEPEEKPLQPENRTPDTEQAGSPNGSDMGVPEGMEEGVEGGVVGGVPGGVIGGCVGCTGDGPVMDYDQPPRVLKQTKPIYPQEAFVKKIEGVVELEVIIDSTGRVAVRRIIHSVPVLDAAAVQTVRQWLFSPAIKNGRPVSIVALIPVSFRIY